MKSVYPCLWFDNQAEEAVNFYTGIFKDSKIGTVTRYGESGAKSSGQKEGSIMTIDFELNGQRYLALNGGPIFKFTPAISMIVSCDTQEEIDYYWAKLSEGGGEVECGWLTDKYGMSWQVVPSMMDEVFRDKDEAKKDRFMAALVKMKKLEIEPLKKALAGVK
jgi:predicted 3-demethylubiquinone-9 3-methyltransferase (glyoxalase superfamily)